jgi:hypothetical protein
MMPGPGPPRPARLSAGPNRGPSPRGPPSPAAGPGNRPAPSTALANGGQVRIAGAACPLLRLSRNSPEGSVKLDIRYLPPTTCSPHPDIRPYSGRRLGVDTEPRRTMRQPLLSCGPTTNPDHCPIRRAPILTDPVRRKAQVVACAAPVAGQGDADYGRQQQQPGEERGQAVVGHQRGLAAPMAVCCSTCWSWAWASACSWELCNSPGRRTRPPVRICHQSSNATTTAERVSLVRSGCGWPACGWKCGCSPPNLLTLRPPGEWQRDAALIETRMRITARTALEPPDGASL